MFHENCNTHTGGRPLIIAIFLNAFIFIVEFVGGLFTNSLALISDALHNLSDFFALILSYFASKAVLWKANPNKSYGYVRIEIFVAFINSITLVVIGGYIVHQGIYRYLHPEPIAGAWMIIIAVIGFLANTASTLLLRKDAHRDLNVKSAYLHLLTDAIESLAVVIVGILIYWLHWSALDPIISVGIGIFVIRSAWNILIETINVLTEGTPRGIDIEDVAQFIRSFPEVENVHHIHVWSLSSQFRALSAHLVIKDQLISEGCSITKRIEQALHDRFKINHPTLQLESEVCAEQDMIVDIHRVVNKKRGSFDPRSEN
jgi:cobalt-zinc-cadmium efflux system protein